MPGRYRVGMRHEGTGLVNPADRRRRDGCDGGQPNSCWMAPGSDKGLDVPATVVPQFHPLANHDPVIGVVTIRGAGVEVLANNPYAILADGISGVGSFRLWVQPGNGRPRGPCPTGQLAPNAAAADTGSRGSAPVHAHPPAGRRTWPGTNGTGIPANTPVTLPARVRRAHPGCWRTQQPQAGCPCLTRRWSADAPGCGLEAHVRELGA